MVGLNSSVGTVDTVLMVDAIVEQLRRASDMLDFTGQFLPYRGAALLYAFLIARGAQYLTQKKTKNKIHDIEIIPRAVRSRLSLR